MTRLFLSLYLFVAVSLVVLSAGLEQIFFAHSPHLSQEQNAWLKTLQATPAKDIIEILEQANIVYSIKSRADVALSNTLLQQFEQNQLTHGFSNGYWRIVLPHDQDKLIDIEFKQSAPHGNQWWLYSSVFFILLGILIAIWIYPLWRDLTALVKATQGIKPDGTLQVPMLSNNSPLINVASALTTLGDKVNALLAGQRELTGAVTHEFKTPIARLKFALVSDNGLTKEEVIAARKDIDELDKLIQEMLDFTKLNSQHVDLHVEEIPVFDMCEQRVHLLSPITPLNIAVSGDKPILTADGHLVSRAIDNLLTNAIRYANQVVQVHLEISIKGVFIHIDDDGPGVPSDHRDRIFDAFFRPDAARNRQRGGTGLGLAIVKRIQQWHGGKVTLTTSVLGGARFSLFYPSKTKS